MHHNNSCVIDDLSLCYLLSSFIILFGIITALMSSLCVPQTARVKLCCILDALHWDTDTESTVHAQLLLRPQFIRHREHDKNNTQGNWHLLLFEHLNHPTLRSSMNQIRVATSCCHLCNNVHCHIKFHVHEIDIHFKLRRTLSLSKT
jgi:hypothetical protein